VHVLLLGQLSLTSGMVARVPTFKVCEVLVSKSTRVHRWPGELWAAAQQAIAGVELPTG
jgi:hypothetical protein